MRVGVPHGPLAELPKLDGLMAPHQLVRGRRRCRRDLQLEPCWSGDVSPAVTGRKPWRKSEVYRCGAVKMVFSARWAPLRKNRVFLLFLISRGFITTPHSRVNLMRS